jgi:predicted dehydrogenase
LIATFSCTTAAAVSEAYRLVLVGTAAVATLTGGKLQIAAADHEATSGGPQDGGPPPTLQELVRLQLERMLAAISGRGSPACTGEAAIMSLASVRAAYQSAERGCWAMVDGGFGQGARRSGQH